MYMVHARRFGVKWHHGKAHLLSAYALQEYIVELDSALIAAFLFNWIGIGCAAAREMKMPLQRQLFSKAKKHLHKMHFAEILYGQPVHELTRSYLIVSI